MQKRSVVKSRDILFEEGTFPYRVPMENSPAPVMVELLWPPAGPGVRLKSVVEPFAEWRSKTLPFYTIRKTRPPSLLGRLFIVTGLVGTRRLRIMIIS
jgi:hypothetical protein